jgi:predicted Zn finger-like uncharacterized protein
MPVVTVCPKCSAKIRVSDNAVGRQIKCPKCTAVFTATAGPASSPVVAPAKSSPSAPGTAPNPSAAPAKSAPSAPGTVPNPAAAPAKTKPTAQGTASASKETPPIPLAPEPTMSPFGEFDNVADMISAPAEKEDTGPRPSAERTRARGEPSSFGDFLAFRVLVGPKIIQILFWVGVIGCIVAALIGVYLSVQIIDTTTGLLGLLWSLAILVVGPMLVRLWCEVLAVIYRIFDTLRDIRDDRAKQQ